MKLSKDEIRKFIAWASEKRDPIWEEMTCASISVETATRYGDVLPEIEEKYGELVSKSDPHALESVEKKVREDSSLGEERKDFLLSALHKFREYLLFGEYSFEETFQIIYEE